MTTRGLVLSLVLGVVVCEKSKIDSSIQKCCPADKVYDLTNNGCKDFDPKYNVQQLNIRIHNGWENVKIANITDFGFPQDCQPQPVAQEDSRLFVKDQGGLELIDLRNNRVCYSNHFCFENFDPKLAENTTIVLICDTCKEKPKMIVNYCCEHGSYQNEEHKNCSGKYQSKDKGKDWKPKALIEAEEKGYGRAIYDRENKTCDRLPVTSLEHPSLKVDKHGNLTWEGNDVSNKYYCLSHVGSSNDKSFQTYIVCKDHIVESQAKKFLDMFDFAIIPGLSIVSMTFLVLTFGILYNEKRNKLFGCMLLSTISMLFIYYLFVSIAKMSSEITSICELVGFVIQYSQLSTFFWLSAIGFNVWNCFRKMEDPGRSQTRGKLGIYDKRYKWYALYAWGCPAFVSVVTLIMHNLPEDQRDKDTFYPEIGDPICSLERKYAQFFYSYIIIGPLLIVTSGFFASIAWTMGCGAFSKIPSMQLQKRIKLVMKMSIVMGPTWIMVVVQYFLQEHTDTDFVMAGLWSVPFHIINGLQGLFLFLVFYFNRERVQMITRASRKFLSRRSTNKDNDTRNDGIAQPSTTQVSKIYDDSTAVEMKTLVNDN